MTCIFVMVLAMMVGLLRYTEKITNVALKRKRGASTALKYIFDFDGDVPREVDTLSVY